MPSLEHEIAADMFRRRPALAAHLLAVAHNVPPPPYELVREISSDLSSEHQQGLADAAAVVLAHPGEPIRPGRRRRVGGHCIVVEIQLSPDAEKVESVPFYGTQMRRLTRRPVDVLVFTTDELAAMWRPPIRLGHLEPNPFTVTVVAYSQVPAIIPPEIAAAIPELVHFAVAAHGADPVHRGRLLTQAAGILAGQPDDEIERCFLYWKTRLGYNLTEHDMFKYHLTEYDDLPADIRSQFDQRHRQGKAEAILTVLSGRNLTVPDQLRTRILNTRDDARLDRVLMQAATASTLADLDL